MKKAPMKQGAFFDWRGGGCIPVGACGLWPQRGIWHPSGLMALGAKGCGRLRRQRGIWHPLDLTALGAMGCIEGVRRFAQGAKAVVWRLLKMKGRQFV